MATSKRFSKGSLSDLGEFGLIRRWAHKLPLLESGVGIGDDAAVLPGPGRKKILFTTDMLIERHHFRKEWGHFSWLGQKALLVNISDISAMGGIPKYAVISLGLSDCPVRLMDQLYVGFNQVARRTGLRIVGGDTNAAPCLIINVAIVGEVAGNPLLRSGARVGDWIYVTGTLGSAALGLKKLQSGKKITNDPLIRRHFLPPIRTDVALQLKKRRVHAMIDVSDGLLADLSHILQASRVGAELWPENLPRLRGSGFSPEVMRKAQLTGGEDYELLFTHPGLLPTRIAGVPITRIGRCHPPQFGLKLKGKCDTQVSFQDYLGFNHFKA